MRRTHVPMPAPRGAVATKTSRGPHKRRLLALGVAGSIVACGGAGGHGDGDGEADGSGGDSSASVTAGAGDTGDPTDPAIPAGAMTRRLTVPELANSYLDVIGFVPEALSRVPPDSHDFDFDRIAQSQTVSPLHLDGFFAAADEATSGMLGVQRLDELAAACPDDIMPPASPTVTTVVTAPALTAAPDWAYSVIDDGTIMMQYAEVAEVGTGFTASAPGRYRLTLRVEADGASTASLTIDGVAVTDWQLGVGAHELVVEVDRASAGPFAIAYGLIGAQVFLIHDLRVEGPLDPGADSDADARAACGAALLPILAERAWRRPPTAAELAQLSSLFGAAMDDGGFAAGLRVAFAVVFNSPAFLYLVEVGVEDDGAPGVFHLTDHELASRLSYAVCQRPPDAELRAAASAGELGDEATFEQHARRLLGSPCARATAMDFYRQWLWLDRLDALMRDPTVFPEFTATLGPAMLADAEALLGNYTFDEPAPWSEFWTTESAWVGPETAELLGVAAPTTQQRVSSPAVRRGLLTQPAVLAATARFAETSPVVRGKYVVHQVLCQSVPPPPTDVDATPPLPDPSQTTRERWSQHSADPACAGCHKLMDPIGFALEEFDALGVHRTTENGRTIDTSGGVPSLGIDDGELRGGVELAAAIAESAELRSCFARQWLRFGLGRLDDDDDAPLLADLATEVDSSVFDAMLALSTSPQFRQRIVGDDP